MENGQWPGTRFVVETSPKIPAKLARLEELANNLWYSWDRPTRTLFARLHPRLWDLTGANPIRFLRRIDEHHLNEAAEDQTFLTAYNRVLSAFDTYHNGSLRRPGKLGEADLVAYFCAEFGFHESFPIYSGGLGILAGDHCKAASDLGLPFVGVGLLYRQGYFMQTIDREGNQIALNADSDFDELPVHPALDDAGQEIHVPVVMGARTIQVKVWWARVGNVKIYLLDTDLPENAPDDREITHRLYGGDRKIRIEQEIVLGVGGARALARLGLKPTVWHINEGHAAFLVLERMRGLVKEAGLEWPAALEAVAANTVFTTHTPVPAGHDHFARDMVSHYFQGVAHDLGIDMDALLALGDDPGEGGSEFNMTALAVRGSRHQNGVSRIHGEVSSRICGGFWPQIPSRENPMGYVTNAVHVPTFLAREWMDLFDRFIGGEWRNRLSDRAFWNSVNDIPDHLYWSVRQSLKSQMLYAVRERVSTRHYRNLGNDAHLERMLKQADLHDPNVLTIGFARRFATYKRADLLFTHLDWLRQIVLNPQCPVLFIFAGKAHPADQPGQDMMRRIHAIAAMPEFQDKILLLENYDMGLARRLVAGVDVWLNTPLYPMEASGTSGMKAGINGTLNLSVLDGWWGEGYDGKNGWAIRPAPDYLDESRRSQEDARTLYEILQDQVVPLYYDRGKFGFSSGWVAKSKAAMATTLTQFNTGRMFNEYLDRYYLPAIRQGARFRDGHFDLAREVAQWKARVRHSWPKVAIRRLDAPVRHLTYGSSMRVEVAVTLDGLQASDLCVELLLSRSLTGTGHRAVPPFHFECQGPLEGGREHLFVLDLQPELCGQLDYHVRIYPQHPSLTHPFEMGLMTWL
ncbi:MAG: alpha-glucan family phosphorylase [Betaproteobacteria bacterium]|nr:alpha-glucan family phosphorylase [Betaproteobacteria bacterium]MDE2622247.1 alpha-glucan family phosphorylase [Betaproteobacteria bacterium]